MKEFISFIATICFLVFISFNLYDYIKRHDKINEEWRQKVNACIIDKNCRKDCELILYRDAQIHNQKVDNHNRHSAMSAGIVGGVIGASMVRR